MINFVGFFNDCGSGVKIMRFVSGYRRKSLFRREKISYSIYMPDAISLTGEDKKRAFRRVQKDFPDAAVFSTDEGEFLSVYDGHRFYAIRRLRDDGTYDFFAHMISRDVCFTTDVSKMSVILSKGVADDMLATIQSTKKERVQVIPIYLSLINEMEEPHFIIVCTSKATEKSKFLARIEDKRLRLVTTSDFAKVYNYDDATKTFEDLHTTNKDFFYTIVTRPEKNLNVKDVWEYAKNTFRGVTVSIPLGKIEVTDHGSKK